MSLIDLAGLTQGSLMPIDFEEKVVIPKDYNSLEGCASVVFSGGLSKENGKFILSGKASASFKAACDFCLTEFDAELAFPICEIFVNGAEESLPPDDDAWRFSGNAIDFSEALRTNFLVNFPPSFICREGCKGLCSRCGQNLNEKSCDCQKGSEDFRFDNLRQLFSNEEV
ncbi:MAG: DUF177 domain-containing protein [Clostridiales bacterium]|jgi:uncharacterized protein|nr:DUF177 domain-containing protein [Clostridiales bacterium]